jgi:hypothetical protein
MPPLGLLPQLTSTMNLEQVRKLRERLLCEGILKEGGQFCGNPFLASLDAAPPFTRAEPPARWHNCRSRRFVGSFWSKKGVETDSPQPNTCAQRVDTS